MIATVSQTMTTDLYHGWGFDSPLSVALRQLNFSVVRLDLRFSVDQETNQVLVKVVDKLTSQVIRQIPSEEIQRLAKVLEVFKEKAFDAKIHYSIGHAHGGSVVQVLNSQNGKVFRQIPTQEVLYLAKILGEINTENGPIRRSLDKTSRDLAVAGEDRVLA